MPSGGTGSKGGDSDLGEPLQLKAEVASFLQGSSKTPEDEGEEMLPEQVCQMCAMEGWEVWCPWLVAGIIYSSAGRHRKTGPRGDSFILTPKVYAWAGP